jgi:small redox-active disulfide protein 2
MKIEILGTGCPKCKQLEINVRKAVEEKKVKADIFKITDMTRIVEYGVMSLPAIIIDGKIKVYGRLAEVKEIKSWL